MGLLSFIRNLGRGGRTLRRSASSTKPLEQDVLRDDVQEKIRSFQQKHFTE
jgi:hypothetical protein